MEAKHWKKIDSTEILNHPRLHLVEDTVELPDGKITTYIRHVPTKIHSVAIIAINDKQEMLIQKEYSYPPNQIMWQLPGGAAHENENIVAAANRELSEESGLIGKTCREIGSFYVDPRRSDMRQYVVLCTGLETKVGQRDDEEFVETHWIPTSELKSMIASGEFNSGYLLAALNIYFAQTD